MASEQHIAIASDADIVVARQATRALTVELGFSSSDQAGVATAVSEIARNIVEYAQSGEIVIRVALNGGHRGIVVVARDTGPGIDDVEIAMGDGYTTGRGLGLGLPGARRLMDEFDIVSKVGKGTTVTMKKWVR
ncbi:MAG: ATP-binding protein [Chloroflexi bacterium]|nr:ATP-binding protein [Chloroflexota bacterium]